MGQYAEEASQIYIERNDGTIEYGGPFDIYGHLRLAKGIFELSRGMVKKNNRDAAEVRRRKALPPLAPPTTPPPQAPPKLSEPKEQDPGIADTPELQGAPDVEPEVTLKPQNAEPLVSRREPSPEAIRQINPLEISELLARLFPPPSSVAEASEIEERVRRNEPEPGEPHPSHAEPAPQKPATAADPVELFTGAFGLSTVDLMVPTPHIPIAMRRSYRSGPPYYGPFGFGWDHDYNVYLRLLNDGGAALWSGQLREQHFVASGTGWSPEAGLAARLERVPGPGNGFEVTFPRGLTWLFEQPAGWSNSQRIPLTKIKDRHGNLVRLTYGLGDRLATVLDDAGRGLLFSYGTCDLLETVTDHNGAREVHYEHDPEIEHLVRVTLPATAEFPGGIATSYVYDRFNPHPAMQHNILQVYDAHDQLTLENEYAGPEAAWAFNSVVRQDFAGFEYRFEYRPLQYVWPYPENADLVSTQTVVRLPDGSLHTYTFNYRGEAIDYRCRLVRDGSFKILSSQSSYDSEGNLALTVGPDGQREKLTFDVANPNPCARRNLLRRELIAPLEGIQQSRVTFSAKYDPVFQLPTLVQLETGAETRMIYDFHDQPVGASGRIVQTKLSKVVLADGTIQRSTIQSECNARGQLTAVVSPEGSRTEFTYASGGPHDGFLLRQTADANASHFISDFEYDVHGFRSRSTHGGRTTVFTNNALGQSERIQRPDVVGATSVPIRQWFGDHGAVVRRERPCGAYSDSALSDDFITDHFEYDLMGRMKGAHLGANTALPRKWQLDLDFRGSPALAVDPTGMRTERTFDERGLILRETVAAGTPEAQTTGWSYDIAGRLKLTEEPDGSLTRVLSRDLWGRPSRGRTPSGAEIIYDWKPGDLLASTSVEGSPGLGKPPRLLSRQTYDHDQRGRLRAETRLSFVDDPDQGAVLTTRYQFDRNDRLVSVRRPAGTKIDFALDGLNRVTRTSDDFGNVREAAYNVAGDLTVLTAKRAGVGAGNPITRQLSYDGRARIITITDPEGKSKFEYDERDELVGRRRSGGIPEAFDVNPFGEMIQQVVDPGGLHIQSTWSRDGAGRPVQFTDPAGSATNWTYDELGRLRKLTFPGGEYEENAYNVDGHQMSRTAASGTRLDFDFIASTDQPARITCLPAPGVAPVGVHTFEYDSLGRVVGATVDGEAVESRYDSLGRLVEERSRGQTVRIIFDDVALTRDLVFPDGRREHTQFDARGCPVSVILAAAGTLAGADGEAIAEVEYASDGRALTIRHANGVSTVFAYDDARRLVRVEHTCDGVMLDSYKASYDEAGHHAVVQMFGMPAMNVVNGFDAKGRLTEFKTGFPLSTLPDAISAADHSTAIEAARIAATAAVVTETYALNADDSRIERATRLDAATTFDTYAFGLDQALQSINGSPLSHDANGARTSDPRHRYEMDALGRVVRILDATGATVEAEFVYDALSRVAGGVETGVPFSRWFDGRRWIHELRGPANTLRQASPHPLFPQPLCIRDAAGIRYPHPDGGLSTLCVTDEAGVLMERHRYGPFGEPSLLEADGITPLAVAAASPGPIWRGMSMLPSTGLYSTFARLYDPATGMFTSKDPLLYVDSPSPYAFAGHNPIDFTDFTGLEKSPLGASQSQEAAMTAGNRTGIDKWLHDDSMGLFWYTAPRPYDLIAESGPVETGSTLGNYAANGWISVSNLVASFCNMPFGVMGTINNYMNHTRFSVEWEALMVMGPMMKTMGLAVELPGGLAGAIGAAGAALKRSGSARRTFMDHSLRTIIANPSHPLAFLIDRATGTWLARSHLSEKPTAQAGHLLTRWLADLIGESERFGVEDSLLNQLTNWLGETGRRAWFVKEAVEVEGVFVEVESLKRWANEIQELAPYLDRPRSPGWSVTKR